MHNKLKDGKYLGLTSLIRRSRTKVFSFVKERVWKRFQGWSNSKISRAEKSIMIKKSIAQYIPTYCMSYFLIPKTLSLTRLRCLKGTCGNLERIIAKEFDGCLGTKYIWPKISEAWGLEACMALIWLC